MVTPIIFYIELMEYSYSKNLKRNDHVSWQLVWQRIQVSTTHRPAACKGQQ